MARIGALYIGKDGCAVIKGGSVDNELTTCRLEEGRLIQISEGPGYPFLYVSDGHGGLAALRYESPEQLARDVDCRLYKTRQGFDAALGWRRAA